VACDYIRIARSTKAPANDTIGTRIYQDFTRSEFCASVKLRDEATGR